MADNPRDNRDVRRTDDRYGRSNSRLHGRKSERDREPSRHSADDRRSHSHSRQPDQNRRPGDTYRHRNDDDRARDRPRTNETASEMQRQLADPPRSHTPLSRPSNPAAQLSVTTVSGTIADRAGGCLNQTTLRGQPITDPRLDFLSAVFDPLLALQTVGLEPPNPRVKPLDNLSKCRFLLPPELPEAQQLHARLQSNTSQEASAAKLAQQSRNQLVEQRRMREENKMPPMLQIVERIKEGPLMMLKKCYLEGTRVRVVTRHAHGIRGVAIGTLRAFDKYLNMVLRDVEEKYTVLLKVPKTKMKEVTRVKPAGSVLDQDGAVEPGEIGEVSETVTVEKTRWVPKQDKRQRKLKQVFLRGDNVVLVSGVSG